MTVRTSERRLSTRIAAAYAVRLCDARGRQVASGRTANVSESGLFALLRYGKDLPENMSPLAEVTVPSHSAAAAARGSTRVVCYRCRIIRQSRLGNLLGVGLEFVEKMN